MACARLLTAEGLAGAQARWSLSPVAPAGPTARDAARQGYLLARALRARLRLEPSKPVNFVSLLLTLGIFATAAPLARPSLRALAVLDRERAAAAIVLNQAVEDERTVLQRVALAHELCHLLFDPVAPSVCSVVIDELRPGRLFDLRESRARGFAAELLLPLPGLQALLGPADRVQSPKAAESLIERAQTHFQSPWEIACNHLYNLHFHDVGPADQWSSSSRSRAGRAEVSTEVEPLSASAPLDASAVTRAQAAHRTARAAQQGLVVRLGEEAQLRIETLYSANNPVAAAVALGAEMDVAFTKDRVEAVRALIIRIDPNRVEGEAMVGLLACLRRGCELTGLGEPFRVLAAHTLDALRRTWGWTEADLEGSGGVLGL